MNEHGLSQAVRVPTRKARQHPRSYNDIKSNACEFSVCYPGLSAHNTVKGG